MLLFSGEEYQAELEWFHYFKEKHTPTLCVLSKADTLTDSDAIAAQLKKEIKQEILVISSKNKEDIEKFKEELIRLVPDDYGEETITGALVEEGDLVLLVMPQDIQAPKGRLILPQVQTIRDLLDHKCLVMSCTTDKLGDTLAALARPPKLIITDSQVFRTVYDKKPQESLLTSFSVLFAEYKGAQKGSDDIGNSYVEIDLTNQHLYLFQNGSIVLETDFVSGNMSKAGCMTPPGVFGLTYKTKNAVLRGADYETPVNYWMPFNGNVGMHDATWRGSFGGTIYLTSGSHGCVNLPLNMAAAIYEYVSTGFPVVCYYY